MQLDAMGLDVQSKLFQPVKPSAPPMSEATSFYLRVKGEGKDKVFVRAAQRNAASVIEVLGDRPSMTMRHQRLASCVMLCWTEDWQSLLSKDVWVCKSHHQSGNGRAWHEGRNPFASIYMPDEMPEERQPIPLDAIDVSSVSV